jgi:hypothetical protein
MILHPPAKDGSGKYHRLDGKGTTKPPSGYWKLVTMRRS